MNRLFQILCIAAVAGVAFVAGATPVGAQAAYAFYGTTAGGATFNRPNTTLTPAPTLSGKIVRYSSQALFTNANGTCTFNSVQEAGFDGVIYLYSGAFDPASPLMHLVAASDNGAQGVHFSSLANVAVQGNQSYYLVTAGAEPGLQGTFTSFVSCTGATRILAGDGAMPSYDGRYSELRKGRFRISATWKNFQNVTGNGTFVPLGSEDSGIVWFFSPGAFELMIKIVDGCSLNNRYWVFLAALTNVEFHVTVYDTWTETTKLYDNTLGVSAAAITDTSAFQTCP
ncbi:MAG: hypothetical protein ABI689_06525 [Thermoanaerobaculia bacterium]